MISKQQFKSQMSRIGALIMRQTPNDMLREMYEIFKTYDLDPFVKAMSDIIREEDLKWFPSPAIIKDYYRAYTPKEVIEPMVDADLEKAPKTSKHKEYLKLIFGLRDGTIDIEDPRVQKCLDKQGATRVFSHYDKQKRCFVKIGREPVPFELVKGLRERAQKRVGIYGEYTDERKDYFKDIREKIGIGEKQGL